MNLRSILGNFLGLGAPDTRSSLRNRAGGLAWISGLHEAGDLNGKIVTTVRNVSGVFWEIDPPLPLLLTFRLMDIRGRIAEPGDTTNVVSIHDDCLNPIPDTGVTHEEVHALFSREEKQGQSA